MATGRTVDKWTRFAVDDSSGTPRQIPIDTLSPVGFVYDEANLTAYQDAVKGYLSEHPDAPLDIGGPWGNLAAAGLAASGAAPTLSGAHTILEPISAPTYTTPLGLAVMFGIQGYWTSGDPDFKGTVEIHDPLTYPQLIAYYDAVDEVQLLRKNGKKKVSAFKLRHSLLPSLIDCIEKWNLEHFPKKVTKETLPASPMIPSGEIIEWIQDEVNSLLKGIEEVPNES
jgi:hypothetical protein